MDFENIVNADIATAADVSYNTEKIMNNPTMDTQLYQETYSIDITHDYSYQNANYIELNAEFSNDIRL